MALESHLIVELYQVAESEVLDSPELMERLLRDLAESLGHEVRAIHVHEFEPYGVSALLLTEKGYVAVHTWPEHEYATANIVGFSVEGEEDFSWTSSALEFLRERLKPEFDSIVEIKSGRIGRHRP